MDENRMRLLYDYVRLRYIDKNEIEAISLLPQIAYHQDDKDLIVLHTLGNGDELQRYEQKLHIAIRFAGRYIQEGLSKELRLEQLAYPEFDWLQSSILRPAFQHLCFRYKNQVYSILIALGKDNNVYVSKQDFENQIRECKNHNLIPCVIPLDSDDFHPLIKGYHLRFSDKSVVVNIKLQSSELPVELSEWEIQNTGLQIVLDDIKNNGGKVSSYCNVLGIEPQVWFEDLNGHRCYVVVATRLENRPFAKKLNTQMYQRFEQFNGYYADVCLHVADSTEEKLYRSHGIHFDFDGLEYIERAAIRTGGTDQKLYEVVNNTDSEICQRFSAAERINKQLLQTKQFILRHEKENNFVLKDGKLMMTDKSLIGPSLSMVFLWLRSLCERNVELMNSLIAEYTVEDGEIDEEEMEDFLWFHFHVSHLSATNLEAYYFQAKGIINFIDAMTPQARTIAELMADKSQIPPTLALTSELSSAKRLTRQIIAQIIARDFTSGALRF